MVFKSWPVSTLPKEPGNSISHSKKHSKKGHGFSDVMGILWWIKGAKYQKVALIL